MRLTRLRPVVGGPTIRLHPKITLLVGLLPFERVELVSTAHSLALGEKPVWEGLVEVAEIEMTLTEAAEVIGRTAEAAPVAAAEAILADPSSPAASMADHASESADWQDLRAQMAEIAEELTGAEKLRAEMKARVTSARANVDRGAFVTLDRAVGVLRRAAEQTSRPDPWTGMSDAEGRLVELERSIREFDEFLDDLPTGDRVELAGALADARAAFNDGEVWIPEAARMVEAWSVLDEHRQAAEARILTDGVDRDGSLARLESARAAFRVAEEAAMPRAVTPQEAAEVERAHENFHIYHEKGSAGLRRGTARGRMKDARAELSTILDSLGYASWSEFRMGNGAVRLPEELMKAYESAGIELNAAESEWGEVTAAVEHDPELREIDELSEEFKAAAALLLRAGPLGSADGCHLREALTDARIDARELSCDPNRAVAGISAALTACGSTGHADIASPRGVVALGESWLAVLRDGDAARRRILHDRRLALSELEALGALGDRSRVDRLDAQREAIGKAEMAVDVSRRALCSIVKARIELHVLAATELCLAEDHDNRAELLERSERQTPSAVTLGEQLVVRGPGGALPIVIIAGSVEPSRLDPLLRLPGDVQVIIIGDGEPMVRWAYSAGSDHASVVDCGVLV